jgi:hypothetical protein
MWMTKQNCLNRHGTFQNMTKSKKTIGKQNADFQIRKFNNNAQPFYVILDQNGELLVEPKS